MIIWGVESTVLSTVVYPLNLMSQTPGKLFGKFSPCSLLKQTHKKNPKKQNNNKKTLIKKEQDRVSLSDRRSLPIMSSQHHLVKKQTHSVTNKACASNFYTMLSWRSSLPQEERANKIWLNVRGPSGTPWLHGSVGAESEISGGTGLSGCERAARQECRPFMQEIWL